MVMEERNPPLWFCRVLSCGCARPTISLILLSSYRLTPSLTTTTTHLAMDTVPLVYRGNTIEEACITMQVPRPDLTP